MPITRRAGIFAVYVPDTSPGSPPLPPIHVLAPTPLINNCLLAIGLVWPTISVCIGLVSGVYHDHGHFEEEKKWFIIQYSTWVVLLLCLSNCFLYYGVKYMFILRTNIAIAEEALNTPRNSLGFGLFASASKSPARFLLATLQITGIGGGWTTLAAASMTVLWMASKDYILNREDDTLGHILAFFWTTGMVPAYLVTFLMAHFLSVRSRRRMLHNMNQSASYNSSRSNSKQRTESHRRFSRSTTDEDDEEDHNEDEEDHHHQHQLRNDPEDDLEADLRLTDVPDKSTLISGLSNTTLRTSYGYPPLGEGNVLEILGHSSETIAEEDCEEAEGDCECPTIKIVSLNPPPRPAKPLSRSSSPFGSKNPNELHEYVFGGDSIRGGSSQARSSATDSTASVGFLSLYVAPLGLRRYNTRLHGGGSEDQVGKGVVGRMMRNRSKNGQQSGDSSSNGKAQESRSIEMDEVQGQIEPSNEEAYPATFTTGPCRD
ncbi:hypothetical protein BG004_001477 [Podila humilis]|nr:hypothetical protein BG004_001477 [Podila humilis]